MLLDAAVLLKLILTLCSINLGYTFRVHMLVLKLFRNHLKHIEDRLDRLERDKNA